MDNKINKVYGNTLIELFDLIIDKLEGNGEYALKDLQQILRDKYKQIIKREQDTFINCKIEEMQNEEEYKNINEKKLKRIVKAQYFAKRKEQSCIEKSI
jgi:hypothetical protein